MTHLRRRSGKKYEIRSNIKAAVTALKPFLVPKLQKEFLFTKQYFNLFIDKALSILHFALLHCTITQGVLVGSGGTSWLDWALKPIHFSTTHAKELEEDDFITKN